VVERHFGGSGGNAVHTRARFGGREMWRLTPSV